MTKKEVNFRGRNTPFMSTDGYVFNSFVDSENLVFTNYLNYNLKLGSHNFEAVAGTELNQNKRKYSSVTGIKFPSDDFQTIDSAGEISAGSGNVSEFAFFSYFGRLNYDFDGKYLFKASIRKDGSSRFGSANRFGVFLHFLRVG